MKRKAFKAAFPYTIPVFLGYICLGIAFGVMLSAKGYHPAWAFVMSVSIFAGAMQFVMVSLLTPPVHILSTIILTLTVNARHLTYGLSLLSKFKNMGKKKLYLMFGLTDETYSLLCSIEPPEDVDKSWFYFFITILDHSYWITGSVIGAVAGSLFQFNSAGIEFSMTALFVVIFINQWENQKNHFSAISGIIISIICLVLFGSGNFLIPAMICILFCLILMKKRLQGEKTDA